MKLRTKTSLPVVARLRGEFPSEGDVVVHYTPIDGHRTWTYRMVRTPEELEDVTSNPALMGFYRAGLYPLSGYETPSVLADNHLYLDEVAIEKNTLEVVMFNPNTRVSQVRKYLDNGDHVSVISDYDSVKGHIGGEYYPIPSRPFYSEAPIITPASADVVEIDFTDFDVMDVRGWIEHSEESLRPGGVFVLTAPRSELERYSRMLASRLTNLVVETIVRYGIRTIIDTHVTLWGVKKGKRSYDPAEEEYLLNCIKPLKGDWQIPYAMTPLNPPVYPPSEVSRLVEVKQWDDAPLLEQEKPLEVAVLPAHGADIYSTHFQGLTPADLKSFGKAQMAWASKRGGYMVVLEDNSRLPELRQVVAQKGGDDWEVTAKGQKPSISYAVRTTTLPVFEPAGNKVHVIPKEINRAFANQWFVNGGSPLKEDEAVVDSKQLVFPVAPSLANLMKLFGQMKTTVVQGKDEVFYLASGNVVTEVVTKQIVDDKGRDVTVENTKKRAKLVTFALTGTEAGQQYEAEMG